MYTPHTVSLMNRHRGSWELTVLSHVMLQAMDGRRTLRAGGWDAEEATLWIPDCSLYLPPKDYAALEDPGGHWTLQPEAESAGRCCFFVPGELSEPIGFDEAAALCDRLYVVTGAELRDYGSRRLRHIQAHCQLIGRYMTL